MPLLVRLAWRNIWRNRRRTLITVSAMAFGLAFCMGMVAYLDGFMTDLFRVMVSESLGHVQIHQRDYPAQRVPYHAIGDGGALLQRLDALAGARQVAPRVHGAALLGAPTTSAGAMLAGVDPLREAALTRLDRKIVAGRPLANEPRNEIIVGHRLAKKLKIGVGAELVAVTQAVDGSLGNELFRVVGLFKSDNVAQDRGGAFVHLRDAQTLLGLTDQLHEIAITAVDTSAIDALAALARGQVADPGLLVRTWYQVNPQLAQMLQLGDASLFFLLVIIFGVSGIGVLNTMLMSVLERSKELGVVSALGLRPWQLVALVLCETLALSLVATAVGVPLGLGLDAYLVWHGLDLSAVMTDLSMMGSTFDPVMHGEFHLDRVVAIVAGLFAITLLAALWPALRAARLRPAVAMRAE